MEIEEYLTGLPQPQQSTLRTVRARLSALLPDAEEVVAYGMPAFRLPAGLVAGYAASARHCSYHPMSGSVLATMGDAVAQYSCSKGTVRFGVDQPLPAELLAALVSARRAELGA